MKLLLLYLLMINEKESWVKYTNKATKNNNKFIITLLFYWNNMAILASIFLDLSEFKPIEQIYISAYIVQFPIGERILEKKKNRYIVKNMHRLKNKLSLKSKMCICRFSIKVKRATL